MRTGREKSLARKIFGSPLTAVVLIVLVAVAIRGAYRLEVKASSVEKDRADIETRAAALATRKETLERNIARLQTSEGLEEEIRTRFNVRKEGEEVAVVVDHAEAPSSGIKPLDTSLFGRIKAFFGRY